MIEFIECKIPGYPPRTKMNVQYSDLTFAFAVNFNSPGEILTKKLCTTYGNVYVPIAIRPEESFGDSRMDKIISYVMENIQNPTITVNIAGNSLETLFPIKQEQVNEYIKRFLVDFRMKTFGKLTIEESCNGGQSGGDLAGGLATRDLGIHTIVRAPYEWMFRDGNGKDIKDEQLFKARFL